MGQSRFVVEAAQHAVREALGDEAHGNLVGVKTQRLGEGLEKRLRGSGQASAPEPALRFLPQAEESGGSEYFDQALGGHLGQDRRAATRGGSGQGIVQQRGAERLQFGPRGDQLRTEHNLRHTSKGCRRREKRLGTRLVPDDVENGFLVRGIGMMAVRVPIGRAKVDFDVAHDHLFYLPMRETKRRAGEVGPSGMIPESGLDDFDRPSIIGRENRLMQSFEPECLHLHFRRSGDGFLAQGMRRKIGGFHSRNLIPGQITP